MLFVVYLYTCVCFVHCCCHLCTGCGTCIFYYKEVLGQGFKHVQNPKLIIVKKVFLVVCVCVCVQPAERVTWEKKAPEMATLESKRVLFDSKEGI